MHEPLEFESWVGLVDKGPPNSEDINADFDYLALDKKTPAASITPTEKA